MRLLVHGRVPLQGSYQVAGSSNEAITLIVAALLSEAPSQLMGLPHTSTVQAMMAIAQDLGAQTAFNGADLTIRTPKLASRQVSNPQVAQSLAAILFLAPILARREHATLEWQGSIGRIYTHLAALRDLGFKVEVNGTQIHLMASPWQNQEIILAESSVTATALLCMLAAAFGEKTILYNAASEPHLRALQQMLIQMGAHIEGIGSNLLTIYGRPEGLHGATQRIQPDHIEAASIAAIAAITQGQVNIAPIIPRDLGMIEKIYQRLGIQLILEGERLHVYQQGAMLLSRAQEDVDVVIDTAPWPGFPSDLVAIATVAASQANGTTLIHEKLFNNRLLFVDKLKNMGAQIVLCDPHRAVVVGPSPLRGEYLDTPDVRIGLALLGAALCAEGQVIIDRAELIERNFENVIQKLIALGASIEVQS